MTSAIPPRDPEQKDPLVFVACLGCGEIDSFRVTTPVLALSRYPAGNKESRFCEICDATTVQEVVAYRLNHGGRQ